MDDSRAFENLSKKLTNFGPIPKIELDKLKAYLEFKNFAKDSVIIRQGQKPKEILFVSKGLLKTSYIESKGKEITKGFAWEDEFCSPYAAFIENELSDFTITAFEGTTALSLDLKHLEHLYNSHSCWSHLSRKYTEKLFVERERRNYQMLALNAKERYLDFQLNFKSLLNRIPQYEIASYLGITAVGLSQIRKNITVSKGEK